MKISRLAVLAGAVVASLGALAHADSTPVYNNGFEAGVTYGFSHNRIGVTPTGRTFLGDFGNDRVALDLIDLPDHDTLTIRFDVYFIRSWDGTQPLVGPDTFAMGLADGPTLLNSTFAIQPTGWERPQTYGVKEGDTLAAMGSGAFEMRTLGYTWAGQANDMVYRFEFAVPHIGSTAQFWFEGSGLQSLSDESWGLDNVTVWASTTAVPAPGAAAVIGLWGGLTARRRRRS